MLLFHSSVESAKDGSKKEEVWNNCWLFVWVTDAFSVSFTLLFERIVAEVLLLSLHLQYC